MATPLILGQYEQGPDAAVAGVPDAEGDDPAPVLDHPTTPGLLDGALHILLRDFPGRQKVLAHGKANVEHRPDIAARGDAHSAHSLMVDHGCWIFTVEDHFVLAPMRI